LSGSRQLFDQFERRVLHVLMLPGERRSAAHLTQRALW
jgi:hypothetical protein